MQRELELEETIKCWRCGALVEVDLLDTTLWDRDLEVCAMCAEDIAREEKWARHGTK